MADDFGDFGDFGGDNQQVPQYSEPAQGFMPATPQQNDNDFTDEEQQLITTVSEQNAQRKQDLHNKQ